MTWRIVYVPGKNLKPEPEVHRKQLWRCLLAGVARVDPGVAEELRRTPECFQLAAWNYVLYERHGTLAMDMPWIDLLIERQGATEEEKQEAKTWHKTATRLMYAIGDRYHSLIRFIPDPRVKEMVADSAPYFENHDGIADRVRDVVKVLIREAARANERILLIGHSMGSVIAYDALWQLSHLEGIAYQVDLFLTLGSPLGLKYTQKHLLGYSAETRTYPEGIVTWANIAAAGDLISVDATVHDDFVQMIEQGLAGSIQDNCGDVYNWFRNDRGLNVHRAYGYLVNPSVGEAVVDWRRRGAETLRAPIMVAHRGYPAKYPENTLIGFEAALRAGAGWLELDVQLCKDGVPVLYHDADTSRISGVNGSLFDSSLMQLKRLHASVPKRFGAQYKGNPVSTLAEFCQFMETRPQVNVFVEIKSESVEHFGVEYTVDRVLNDIHPIRGRCVVISFHDATVEYARAGHGVRIGWVLPQWSAQTEVRARQLQPEFLLASRGLVPANGCDVWLGPWQWVVYVVDDVKQANLYPSYGIQYVETDKIADMLVDPGLRRHRQETTDALGGDEAATVV